MAALSPWLPHGQAEACKTPAKTEPVLARQVYLYGAVVTSWTQPSGDEVLYVRPDAKFDKSKPISGGIPHCFPQVDSPNPVLG